MALKKCKECGGDVSSEAKVCPHCGKKHPTGERIGCIAGLLIVLAIGTVMSIFSHDQTPTTTEGDSVAVQARSPSVARSAGVPYKEIEEWAVGEVIVIDPRFRSDSSLRALGSQLAARYATSPFFNVLVYDSERAARLRQVIDTVTAKDRLAFYDRHFLATYTKNGTTGFHALEYSLKGIPNAVPKRINY